MSTTETVRVTADHIDNGQPQDPCACPIALALRELHPGAEIDVYGQFAMIITSPTEPALTASMPLAAFEFIEAFDFGDAKVEPVEFELTWQNMGEIL